MSIESKDKLLYRYSRYIKLIFLFWDFILLIVSYLFSFLFRFGNLNNISRTESEVILVLSIITWVLLAYQNKAYKIIRTEYIEKILYKVFKMVGLLFSSIFMFLVLLNYDDVSRLQIVYFVLTQFILVLFFRILFLQILKRLRKAGFNYRNVIIIGSNENAIGISQILSRDMAYGYRVLGFFSDTDDGNVKVNVIGKTNDALSYVVNNHVHEVYISLFHVYSGFASELITYCESNLIRVKLIPDFTQFTKSRHVQIDFYDNIPVVSLRQEPLERTVNRIIKRIFDILFSLMIIVLIFPWLLPILMVAIKLSSKGPIFFRQQRSGENNHTFWCYKFRTMKVNDLADELQATRNDSRITKIGRIMRKTNLDELPQFFNVFIGNMSVVGPRPHMLKHTKEYSELISTYLVRHLIKPGITGWAQVNGFRGETINIEQMEKRVEYDIWYIENWSFLLDLKIIYLTIRNIFIGERNAF